MKFKIDLVKFNNGNYGVRVKEGKSERFIENNEYDWGGSQYVVSKCQHSKRKAEKLFDKYNLLPLEVIKRAIK